MSYTCVEACAEDYPVSRVCEVLGLSESVYYAWMKRQSSERKQSNQTLKARIMDIWKTFKHCYGAPHKCTNGELLDNT